jgi:nucleoid-associated protein
VTAEGKDFLALTSRMMEHLAREAAKKSASEGGHVFFAHFRREGSDYLLVTIVTDKLSAALTRSGGITDVEHLDLDGSASRAA